MFEKFKELDALPVNVDNGEQGTALAFVENNASWHKQCHQKFNNSKLERVKQRLQKRKRSSEEGNSTSACRSKHKPSEVHRLCIFCSNLTSEELHEFTTFNIDKKTIRDMASEMWDSELLIRLAGGIDLVAAEKKYHLSCLTKYRNRYRSFVRSQSASSKSSIVVKQAKARAFAELVMHIESSLEEGIYVFKLTELHDRYENRSKKLHVDFSTNRTRLNEELTDYSKEHGIQEQSEGKNVILLFPEGMHSLLQNMSSLDSQINSETLQLASVAKIIRQEIFQEESNFRFGCKFPPNCQKECVPYNLNLLISMILYGPNQDSHECTVLSRYISINTLQLQEETNSISKEFL